MAESLPGPPGLHYQLPQTKVYHESSPDPGQKPESANSAQNLPAHINPHHRILRLERNIAWLTEQHSSMLAQLHNEIESLKCRNRELQFQLLMGAPAGTTSSLIPTSGSDAPTNLTTLANPSNLGTPEDAADIHGNNLTLISTLGGVAPLQAEILDNEIKELQATLHEARSRNVYLSSLVEQQKRKLAQLEEIEKEAAEKEPSRPASSVPPDFLRKLAEAEELVQTLRKQNDQQQAELLELRGSMEKTLERSNRMKYRGCNHPTRTRLNRGVSLSSSTTSSMARSVGRFPPLPSSSRRGGAAQEAAQREGEVGGSDSRLSVSSPSSLPRLHAHRSQPSLAHAQQATGPTSRERAKPLARRLPPGVGPRYGSLDRKSTRS